ncbi:Anion exchange protein [Aphelenchoides besseyi]|nr:Anion exchange protein [Aphelenchoides besseyi]
MDRTDETKKPLMAVSAEDVQEHLNSSMAGRKRSAYSSNGPHVTFDIGCGDSEEQHHHSLLRDPAHLTPLEENSPQRVPSYETLSNISSATDSMPLTTSVNSNQAQIFVELYDLKLDDATNVSGVWRETARWIKYEEDVEGADLRWGRPHVPLLSFHALNLLPTLISKGVVLLDSKARSFVEVCDDIAKGISDQCNVDSQQIKKLLLLNHSHVPNRRISRISTMFFDRSDPRAAQKPPERSRSAAPFPQTISAGNPIHQSASTNSHLNTTHNDLNTTHNSLMNTSHDNHSLDPSPSRGPRRNRSISTYVRNKLNWNYSRPAHLEQYKNDFVLRKCMPSNMMESALVFTGAFPLSKIRFFMLRFHTPIMMPEIVEMPTIPVRYIFVILGPDGIDVSYHELGRAVATLMSNPSFNTLASKAQNNEELLKAFESFLDSAVIIPNIEVDSIKLIPGDEIKRALKRRPMEKEMNRQKPDMNGCTVNGNSKRHCANGIRPMINGGDPPGDDPSKRKRRFFNGLVEDVKNRFPHYGSDFRDALNFQCLTSVIFLFLASVAPAITFGGLLGSYTDEKIGTIETLIAQCICGVIWGLFSAQPLLIMSATGPVLVFETALYVTCNTLDLDFLEVRLFAGIWIFLITIVISAVDGSRLLVYVTRFTEDIFATLISIIFIAESFSFINSTFKDNPVENFVYYETAHAKCGENHGLAVPNLTFAPIRNVDPLTHLINNHSAISGEMVKRETVDNTPLSDTLNTAEIYRKLLVIKNNNGTPVALQPVGVGNVPCLLAEPNTALLTAIIMFSTFALAFLLKKLRESFYLGRHLRRALGDFGVLIAVALVALAVQSWIPDPFLARLEMPDELNFTNPKQRAHGLIIIPVLNNQNWHGIFVALVAALLVFILLFVETEITELLLAKKERGCRKGSGMNWDLVLLGFCSLICSVCGLPWMVAAAVQSLAHCSSLTVYKKKAPGAKCEVERVYEQRVTTIGVSLLMGIFAFAGRYLRLPLASLFGVFLYLGVMNLSGVHLMHRVILFFVPVKYYPQRPYTETVKTWKMHFYTWLQIACLFFVYTIKHFKRTALMFPFVLMLFIVFRHVVLPKVFDEKELQALDGEEEEEDYDNDFYDHPPIPV